MGNFDDFRDLSDEFSGKTEEELLEEFMNESDVTDECYISLFGLWLRKMRGLSSAAKDLFIWMAFHCDVDKGRVSMQSFSLQTALRELDISSVTYYRCLGELKEKDFIRGGNARYYINPRIVWRGCSARRAKFVYRYPNIRNGK
jgi:hypothetical protein